MKNKPTNSFKGEQGHGGENKVKMTDKEILKHIKALKINKEDKYILLMDENWLSEEEMRIWAKTLVQCGYHVIIARVKSLDSVKLISL